MTQTDTSGAVQATNQDDDVCRIVWHDLSSFTQGYIEALFSDLSADVDFVGEWVVCLALAGSEQRDLVFSDLASETLARIIADCRLGGGGLRDDADGGRDYWTLRQAGLLRNSPPLTVQLGSDGKVVFS